MNMGRPVFDYHGGRAGLGQFASGGPPVGLGDLRNSAITLVGVPQNHYGALGSGRDYIADLQTTGCGIIRTIETPWDPGKGQKNLGLILASWRDAGNPGQFFTEMIINTHEPRVGFGWDLEYDVIDLAKYPLTAEDRTMAASMALNPDRRDDLVTLRCRQFATIVRLTKFMLGPGLMIVYSSYGTSARADYGCDWELLADRRLSWRGVTLPPVDYGHCAYFAAPELPGYLVNWCQSAPMPILHNIGLPASMNNRRDLTSQIRNRLGLMRGQDGFGKVDVDDRLVLSDPVRNGWDYWDTMITDLITQAVRTGTSGGIITNASWGEVKNGGPRKIRR